MRHRHSGRKFNRTASHRKAMFLNMTNALVLHELIKTTLPKAKELRRFVEPLVTLAGTDSLARRRLTYNRVRNRATVQKLFDELGPRYVSRPGGYIRIMKCGFRQGDKAPMAYAEFVDRPDHIKDAVPAEPSTSSVDTEDKAKTPPTTAPAKKKWWKNIFSRNK